MCKRFVDQKNAYNKMKSYWVQTSDLIFLTGRAHKYLRRDLMGFFFFFLNGT